MYVCGVFHKPLIVSIYRLPAMVCLKRNDTVLICAEDGWVADWSKAIPKKWNFKGCTKYQRITIHCLLPEGRLEYAKPRLPEMGWLDKAIWRTVNSPKEIVVDFSSAKSESLETFKACLIQAVRAGDDVLTQFKDEMAIIESISGAETYSELRQVYQESGWA